MINLPNTKLCHLDFQNEWLTISLDNRKKRNALSSELIVELMEVLDLVRDEKIVRGILIKGQNDIFCSGADLDELHQITYNKSHSEKMTIDMSTKIGHLLNLIDAIPKLTVSVIEGACIAGGFGMACATDVIITMLTDDVAVEKVMGDEEFIKNISANATVIDMSSVNPVLTNFAVQKTEQQRAKQKAEGELIITMANPERIQEITNALASKDKTAIKPCIGLFFPKCFTISTQRTINIIRFITGRNKSKTHHLGRCNIFNNTIAL